MVASNSLIDYEDATLTTKLHVAPDFTGRVIAYFEKGELKADMRLRKNELTTTLEGFLELARSEGWTVCPPPILHWIKGLIICR